MGRLLKGAPVAAALCEEIKQRVSGLADGGVVPCLAVVRAGAREDDLAYERGIKKRCEAAGVLLRVCELAPGCSTDDVVGAIKSLGGDGSVHGILVMRPLSGGADDAAVCAAVPPEKDVDGVSAGSMSAVYSGRGVGFPPCTAEATVRLFKHYGVPLEGASAAVVGRSLVIGRPAAMLLMRENATVTLCHSRTRDLSGILAAADIVVAAAGSAELIDGGIFKEGCAVADVGVNFTADGRMTGDVRPCASSPADISPVPGGVGAVTSAVAVLHTVQAAERQCR